MGAYVHVNDDELSEAIMFVQKNKEIDLNPKLLKGIFDDIGILRATTKTTFQTAHRKVFEKRLGFLEKKHPRRLAYASGVAKLSAIRTKLHKEQRREKAARDAEAAKQVAIVARPKRAQRKPEQLSFSF